MSHSTKLGGLTALQVLALTEAIQEGFLSMDVELKRTSAIFPWSAAQTSDEIEYAKEQLAEVHGSRRHPVASLHAVVRKAQRLADDAS